MIMNIKTKSKYIFLRNENNYHKEIINFLKKLS